MVGILDEAAPAGSTALRVEDLAHVLADVLAEILDVASVTVDSHVFDDLGADSMSMARFCARVRKRPDAPSVSMKDVYRHPTLRGLAEALAPAPAVPTPAPAERTAAERALDETAPLFLVPPQPSAAAAPAAPEPVEPAARPRPATTAEYVLCGALQLLLFVVSSFCTALMFAAGYHWISGANSTAALYGRSVVFGSATFTLLFALPVLTKWVMVGRWQPQEIRIWSLRYVRFWVAKTLVQKNPLILVMIGSPLYSVYLRALGARVGPGVTILTRTVPACPDLLTVGAGTVIRQGAYLNCYRARAGVLALGPVTLGKDVYVGELAVLDIGTSMGDGAQLGHASSLHTGQAVPAGERWHGSPAQPTDVDYRTLAAGGSARSRVAYSAVQLLMLVFLTLPLAVGGIVELFDLVPRLGTLVAAGPGALATAAFYRDTFALSYVLYFGAVLAGFVYLLTVPRVLNRALEPDRVYPLYGLHYGLARAVTRMTNRQFYTNLYGDSSCIVDFLRWLGYQLSPVQQTGSNFGLTVKHDNPFLSSVGTGTVVADGLSFVNADYSATSFRLSRVSVGRNNFVGNNIAYPALGKTGDDCLLGTKVMIPIDGPVRTGVGLLGSPCFEIPRTVARDAMFDLQDPDDLRRRLAAKNRHNAVTIGLYLLVRWLYFFGVMVLAACAVALYEHLGVAAIALANLALVAYSLTYWVAVKRAVTHLVALRPSGCSIYDQAFWGHERFWKVPSQGPFQLLNGTPFKNVLSRAIGVRIGRRVFDDGCALIEPTLVSIGDECTLNTASIIQTHSQEDGAFKSDRSSIAAGVTLGVGAFVHYGVTMGEGAELAPDSFLMKGEEVPSHAAWGGNPAREMQAEAWAAPIGGTA